MIQVVKELKDNLFLLMIIQQAMIKFLLILIKNNFFQETITISKMMVETFMINQLMIQLDHTIKLEKYQQDQVMIIQLVVY